MAEQAEENNAMNVQMEQMMRDYKLAQNRQMEIFKAQMKAQKELNRFLTISIFVWYFSCRFLGRQTSGL